MGREVSGAAGRTPSTTGRRWPGRSGDVAVVVDADAGPFAIAAGPEAGAGATADAIGRAGMAA
jgi:hypothetical protein